MDTHYGYTPVYAPTQPPEHRHGFTPVSTAFSSSGPNLSAYTTTLPPLSQGYSSHYSNDQSSYSAQTSQASYTSSNATSSSHSGSYLTYASQVPTHYHAQPTYTHTPRHLPSAQDYSTIGNQGALHHAYSSASTQSGKLADIRPMPAGGARDRPLGSSSQRVPIYPSLSQVSTSQHGQPTHVVGSQGRRGILPSEDGRPIAVEDNSSKAASTGLRKDPDDGKWPCEHCNKRYLHAKHLKRHLLRHTGTRPYSCGLCKDTFSRSDILKRHFAKCSIRRGNPTGANHLTHSRATRRLKLEQDQDGSYHSSTQSTLVEPSTHSLGLAAMNGLGSISSLSSTDLAQSSFSESQRPLSTQLSRANSFKGLGKGVTSTSRGNYTAPNSAGLESAGFSYSGGQATPDSLTTSGAATPFNYSNDPRSNQLSPHSSIHQSLSGLSLDLNSITRSLSGPSYANGVLPHIVEASHDRTGDMDWSLPHLEGSEDYTNGQYQTSSNDHHQPIKADPGYSSSAFNMPHRYPSYQATKH